MRFLIARGIRTDVETPTRRGRLVAEDDVDALELVAARDEDADAVARLVLFETSRQLARAQAKITNGEDLVLGVEARGVRRRAAPDLRDDLAPRVAARGGAEPGLAGQIVVLAEAQPEPVERLGVIELLGRLQRPGEPGAQVGAGDLLRRGAELILGEAARAGIPLVHRAHQIVERPGALRRVPDLRVEDEGDHRALRVVADGRIDRVLVGTVLLDPRVERRHLDRLREAAGPRLQGLDEAAQLLEELVARLQPGPPELQRAVVVGEAFRHP